MAKTDTTTHARQASMRVSIVIPVYNEADALGACLAAIAQLNDRPFEVIVVDNNSTDDSVAIALRYPFARVLHEQRQGVVHARNSGFNAARGDIIARIDADTIVPRDWLAQIRRSMANTNVAAVSGYVEYYDMAFISMISWWDRHIRRVVAAGLRHRVYLYGSNMAIRRDAWQSVSKTMCEARGYHEDLDLAAHLALDGSRGVLYDPRLAAGVSARRIESSFWQFCRYMLESPRTYQAHGLKAASMYVPVILLVGLYPFLHFAQKAYDPQQKRFILSRLFTAQKAARLDPAAFVD